MKRSAEMRTLDQIVAVRDLQRFAAAERAGCAAKVLRDRRRQVEASEHRAVAIEEGWYGALSKSFSPEAASSWAHEMVREQQALSGASDAVIEAEADVRARAGDWHAAAALHDSARDMLQQSRRVASGHDDEAGLQEATDLALRKRGRA